MLGENGLSFGLLNGQLVLWPAQEALPTGVERLSGTAAPPPLVSSTAHRAGRWPGARALAPAGLTSPKADALLARPAAAAKPGRHRQPLLAAKNNPQRARQRALAGELASEASKTQRNSEPLATQRQPSTQRRAGVALLAARPPHRLPVSLEPGGGRRLPEALVPLSPPPAPAGRQRLAQVSLVPPLSTSGRANALTTNSFSLNILAGRAAGVRVAELGGLLNLTRDSVRGFQAAGLLNRTGLAARGVQLAGLLNVVGGAGAARPAAQAGLLQAAGLANVARGSLRGAQAAPLNLAREVRGIQLGVVNRARQVRGVQLGLVNVADSVKGFSLSLVTIVRHGGYRHGEVWASESLPLNAVLKLGLRRYYTMLGAAAEPFGSRVQWAAGLGLGTAGRPHGRYTFSLDLLNWVLAGTTYDDINWRQLLQLRPAVAWQIEPQGHLQLVLSPTLNWAHAYGANGTPDWDFGSNQLLLLDTSGSHARNRLWPGLQLGLRF